MRRTALVFAALTAFAAAAAAQDLPPGRGTFAPSGSTFTTSISPAQDVDDYVLQGLPGVTVTAVVTPTKPTVPAARLVPSIEFVRPDGTIPDDDAGFTTTVRAGATTATMTLDAVGWWQVRVAGANLGTLDAPNYSTGPYSVSVVYKAAKAQPTLPVVTKSFAMTAPISSTTDVDDYPFEAYPGESIAVTVAPAKRSKLVPGVTLLRPDGSQVAGAGVVAFDGKSARAATVAGDSDRGTWHVRVSGVSAPGVPNSPTTGSYVLSVKLGKPASPPSLVPDVNGQFRFTISAVGGATVAWKLAYKGQAPALVSFVDPTGAPVASVAPTATVGSVAIPNGLPAGPYTLTFDAENTNAATFASRVTSPKSAKKRVAKLSPVEPLIVTGGIDPLEGGAGVTVSVRGLNVVDPSAPNGTPGLALNDIALTDVHVLGDGQTVVGTIPAGTRNGVYDVVLTSTSGQATAIAAAFTVLPAPILDAVDTAIVPTVGGYVLTLTGRNFRPGKMALVVDGQQQPETPTYVDATTVKIASPAHGAGVSGLSIRDLGSRETSNELPITFVSQPVTAHVTPPLVALLTSPAVTLYGFGFSATDHVWLETTTPGVFEDLAASQSTFVDYYHHAFTAPLRPKGAYSLYVQDVNGRPTTPTPVKLTYFAFADATAASGLAAGPDLWDAASSAIVDVEGGGHADVVLSRRGSGAVAATSQTRVLRNDGSGHFADVTASVMPPIVGDDWRADRVVAADIDLDGHVDLVLTTNSTDVPGPTVSHTRILMNEVRGGTGAGAADRVFRDRTSDVMASPRTWYSWSGGGTTVADDWRGFDLWVGDLDKSSPGRPSILVTHDETTQELDVSCSPYCSSPFGSTYTYGFYWGGSRAFFWDKKANGGLGKYKFERNFFPRKSGLRVPVVGPGGASIPICNSNYGQPCAGKFTPFTGQRLAVGDLDGDGKLDVAVVSNAVVQRIYPPSTTFVTISSLQVAVQLMDLSAGSEITDVTSLLTAIGGDFKADAVAIGATGFPDGNAYGTIAVAKAAASGNGSMLRLVKFKAPTVSGQVAAFEETTSAELPPTGVDQWQASRIVFADVDGDGRPDLVLLAPAPLGGSAPSLRVLRDEIVAGRPGLMTTALFRVLPAASAGESFEGDALAVGDVTGDGLLDFVVSRAVSSGSGTQTRVVKIDH